jgi:hypothetical protein
VDVAVSLVVMVVAMVVVMVAMVVMMMVVAAPPGRLRDASSPAAAHVSRTASTRL